MDLSRRALFQAAVSIIIGRKLIKCAPADSTGAEASVALPPVLLEPGQKAEFTTSFAILAPVRAWGVDVAISIRYLTPSGPIFETLDRRHAYIGAKHAMLGDTLNNRLTVHNEGDFPLEIIGLKIKLPDVDPTAIRQVKAFGH